MAKTPTEHLRDLTAQVRVLEDRDASRRLELEELKGRLQQEQAERKATDEKARDDLVHLRLELAEARQETAVLKRQFEDHLAQYQEHDKRRWGSSA